ncbi:hypothetical protein Poli38472_009809 [Pythium oligandrum]|uniref:Uncharacterized protein n=1 Tax=Pythium oligandrum TaxID=41045 RepID=A0A8K1CF62_PYTOL|nr:hypothetical protein Poli38472_009809 [Pythium oligandrum]|eukprot:TMW62316.1 hypothetical protein Poli38472_009809 [Pythium oligandrum]
MKRCWKAVPHENASDMSQDEYEDMYSILLYEMTICWDEDLNNAILAKMWQRDAAHHPTINWARFCCSLFYYIEMWVEEITLAEYERIFCYVHLVISGQEHMAASHATSPTAATTFKPTLESFDNALDNDKAMEELHMNFGKSISFNAAEYYQHFGAPSMSTHAFQTTLLQAA